MTLLDVITRYYEGCSTGDVDLMLSTVDAEVVHWFLAPNPGSAAVRGGEHPARYWRKVHHMIDARWSVDHCLAGEGEAVIEWTMLWRSGGERTETTELDGFPYAARGYPVPPS